MFWPEAWWANRSKRRPAENIVQANKNTFTTLSTRQGCKTLVQKKPSHPPLGFKPTGGSHHLSFFFESSFHATRAAVKLTRLFYLAPQGTALGSSGAAAIAEYAVDSKTKVFR
jgi:hypothetical protein